jgi:hypothetical protein
MKCAVRQAAAAITFAADEPIPSKGCAHQGQDSLSEPQAGDAVAGDAVEGDAVAGMSRGCRASCLLPLASCLLPLASCLLRGG